MDGQRHSQAASDKHSIIQSAESNFELMAADLESGQVKRAVNDVSGEEPAEEHDFGEKKDPHDKGVCLALLLHVFELMRKARRMRAVDRHISHGSPYYWRSHRRLQSPRESPQNFQ